MTYPRRAMTRRRLVLAVLAPAAALAFGAALGRIAGAPGQGAQATLWSVLVSQTIWATFAISGAALATGASVSDRLGLQRGRLGWGELAVAVVGFVALSNAFHLVIQLLSLAHTGTLGRIDTAVRHSRGASPWLALLALGLAPGICEELLFRGFVQRIVRFRLGAVAGVLTSAVAFAVAHWDPAQSTAAFGLGLYLGAVAELSDSTRPSMLCHIANNGTGVALGLLGAVIPEGGGWLTAAGLTAVAVAGLAWLAARTARRLGMARGQVVGQEMSEGEGEPQEPTP